MSIIMNAIIGIIMSMTQSEQDYFLMQVNDAVFPIGAYAHSYGLETYVARGIVHDTATAREWIDAYMRESFLYNDMMASRAAYRAAAQGDTACAIDIEKAMRAMRTARETREACYKLGQRLVKNVLSMMDDVPELFSAYVEAARPIGYSQPVIYGVICAAYGIGLERAMRFYAYAKLSSLVTTCVKLIPLSQRDGQIILRRELATWESIVSEAAMASDDGDDMTFGFSTPGLDIRSMQHETLYSRLYMS